MFVVVRKGLSYFTHPAGAITYDKETARNKDDRSQDNDIDPAAEARVVQRLTAKLRRGPGQAAQ